MTAYENLARRARAIDIALLMVRIILGVIFIAHGSQKLFGAFGGLGLEPWITMVGKVGYLVAIGEFFGGIGILVGILSRFSSAAIICIMLGAITLVHAKNGFFIGVNGIEFALALIGLAFTILVLGPGRFALIRWVPLPRALRGYLD